MGVLPTQQPRDAFVVRIIIAAQIGPVDEFAACLRRLEQERGGELAAVEMPVQRLALAVGHDVRPCEVVARGKQRVLAHRRRKEGDEVRPFIDPQRNGLHDLVGADRVVHRLAQRQRRMIGR